MVPSEATDLVRTRHDSWVWSGDPSLTLAVSQHSLSASNPDDNDAFWTLGYFTDAPEFVETATKTGCVRDGSGRISVNIRTDHHFHSTTALRE